MLGPAFNKTDLKKVELWLEPRLNSQEMPQLSSDAIEDMLRHLQRTGLTHALQQSALPLTMFKDLTGLIDLG